MKIPLANACATATIEGALVHSRGRRRNRQRIRPRRRHAHGHVLLAKSNPIVVDVRRGAQRLRPRQPHQLHHARNSRPRAGRPVYDVSTMEQRLSESLARQRFSMVMLGAFAAFALILAAIGVYGVMSYVVTQGTRDIAIRVALGAQESNILRLVVRQGMTLAMTGIAAGVIGAFALSRVMSALLFGVSDRDSVTFAAVPAILAVIALAACYIPARRAIKVDPITALRYE